MIQIFVFINPKTSISIFIKLLNISLFILSLFSSLSAQAQVSLLKVYFDKNSSQLSPEARTRLDSLCAIASASGLYALKATGYASAEGSKAHNLVLSKNRVKAVQNYVQNCEAEISSESAFAEGETENFALGTKEDAFRVNRCVLITWTTVVAPTLELAENEVLKEDENKEESPQIEPIPATEPAISAVAPLPVPEPAPEIALAPISELYHDIALEMQHFFINPEQDTALIC